MTEQNVLQVRAHHLSALMPHIYQMVTFGTTAEMRKQETVGHFKYTPAVADAAEAALQRLLNPDQLVKIIDGGSPICAACNFVDQLCGGPDSASKRRFDAEEALKRGFRIGEVIPAREVFRTYWSPIEPLRWSTRTERFADWLDTYLGITPQKA